MAICSDFTNVLDLECLFVHYFAGTAIIFMLIATILIFIVSVRFRFTGMSIFASIAVFALMFYTTAKPIGYMIALIIAVIMAVTIVRVTNNK